MTNDQHLQQTITNILKAKHITGPEVEVIDGQVIFKGSNATRSDILRAEKAIKHLKDIRVIIDESGPECTATNSSVNRAIAARITKKLQEHREYPLDNIWIRVSCNCIFIDGTVDWPSQRNQIGRELMNIKGVAGICNLLSLKKTHHS